MNHGVRDLGIRFELMAIDNHIIKDDLELWHPSARMCILVYMACK